MKWANTKLYAYSRLLQNSLPSEVPNIKISGSLFVPVHLSLHPASWAFARVPPVCTCFFHCYLWVRTGHLQLRPIWICQGVAKIHCSKNSISLKRHKKSTKTPRKRDFKGQRTTGPKSTPSHHRTEWNWLLDMKMLEHARDRIFLMEHRCRMPNAFPRFNETKRGRRTNADFSDKHRTEA